MHRRALISIAFALALAAPAFGQVASESSVSRITLADFKQALDAGRVITIDVRDPDSYAAGHIPGALSVPLDTVGEKAAELGRSGKLIVAYCA
jgi:rhodanese-related sulfurtransferase